MIKINIGDPIPEADHKNFESEMMLYEDEVFRGMELAEPEAAIPDQDDVLTQK